MPTAPAGTADPMDRHCYLSLADELNDTNVKLTLADFDPGTVAAAERHAAACGYSWPPQPGDYDRRYEEGATRNVAPEVADSWDEQAAAEAAYRARTVPPLDPTHDALLRDEQATRDNHQEDQ